MALKVNGEPFAFREGLTVDQILAERKYSFPLKNVFVNGQRIPKEQWATFTVRDGDEIDVIHLMGGG